VIFSKKEEVPFNKKNKGGLMFKKVLIANRGEIAIRVMRTLKEMGIISVAVYSEPDRDALHTLYADEAYPLGGVTSAESYLKGDLIIQMAKDAGVDAIHPGYGFLSENSNFSKKCKENGIVFIGPSEYAIDKMGDKITARKIMEEAGVPVVPGLEQENLTEEQAKAFAEKAGFPVMVKASAGGGGKGMRKVNAPSEFTKAFRAAKSEALSSFGNDTVYVEKFVENPRHIEIQIIADSHGNVVYLGDRECSVQRRHQKIIEEAPSSFITEKMRKAMGETAVKSAKAVGYVNAGTVEFLVDKNRNFYFLEMNTRLQVEHPVTEWVTGVDLVELMIKVAEGESLPLTQEEVTIKGAAIECRIYAEDPENNFMPSPGEIVKLSVPGGSGIRDDSGVYQGCTVSMFYDPLISKLSVFGKDRQSAITRMKRALGEYVIVGIKTNISFHKAVLSHNSFIKGDYDTTFIDKYFDEIFTKNEKEEVEDLAIVATALHYFASKQPDKITSAKARCNRWKSYSRQCWSGR